MSDDVEARLATVLERIGAAEAQYGRAPGSAQLIAVSKTFDADAIRPVIAAGQRRFGENRVQEAQSKWPALRAETTDIELHLIGPLQSNKAREAVSLFDAIHTIDRDKIAGAIADEMARLGRTPLLFVQVNTGLEPQKAGIAPREAVAFVERCRAEHGLAIAGLMCIPPANEIPGPHFALLAKLAAEAGLRELSMGMSSDFETAIAHGATYMRVGGAIFGHRPPIA
ncbi:YggS family pyridoxal phosphate-dependent enzyme [Kaistia dalseonensis]|uniref:Pyridoxal phosphate homeostasis protein n=1 Tax=Kaistia dalseonensis TaxID=410840 RepID=A0ABU0H790_9HYPH|nr:YggS family pyridoxal phosphate-dependent enzyme [Kaistia dalseonensis]MCX5494803.1 YggS family pyridoxal phosphate-dependent enzyme [Kaistia dalseonensis]MDQ0437384.1 pyridoxal phosphate enzyme (YggS family) [Kaistia dalseonensis]